jgi:hypothetical protein
VRSDVMRGLRCLDEIDNGRAKLAEDWSVVARRCRLFSQAWKSEAVQE